MDMNRRDALRWSAMMAAAAWAPVPGSAATGVQGGIDFDDPEQEFEARIKTLGSLDDEDVFRLSQGHIYGFVPGKPVFPLCNYENYSVSRWKRLPNGDRQFTLWEVGLHTDRVTDEPLETLLNPVTGEEVEVIPYAVGPLTATITPAGVLIPGRERTVQPQALKPRSFDGTVWYPFESPVTLPNPLPPDAYPEASAGDTFSWHTVLVFAASLADLGDPEVRSAPALSTYSEFLSWQPWLHMGQQPGGMMTRGYGKKFGPESKLPADRRRKIEETVPEMLDRDSWTEYRNEFSAYKARHAERGKD
jgi:hypothetical protein